MTVNTSDRTTATPSEHPAALAPRFRLDPALSREGVLDGAWWPRSRDPDVELSVLIAALDSRLGRVSRVALNMTSWDSAPRRLTRSDRGYPVGWFRTMDADMITVTTAEQRRFALLVIPPQAPAAAAAIAMAMAVIGKLSLRPAKILMASGLPAAGDTTRLPLQLPSAPA